MKYVRQPDNDQVNSRRISMVPLKLSADIRFTTFCALAIALLTAVSAGQSDDRQLPPSFTFTTIDAPNATATTASDVNNAGGVKGGDIIVGDYTDSSGKLHGYLRTMDNQFVTLDYPGATATSAWGINDNNIVVGYYIDASNNTHGFMWTLAGSFVALDYPGATFTIAYGINNSNQIVGTWATSTTQSGFYWVGNNFTNVAYPGASATVASGINSAGQICGAWFDSKGFVHGFTATSATGTYSDFNAPASKETDTYRSNDLLQYVGYSVDLSGGLHGMFAWPGIDQFVPVAAPGSEGPTIVRGLNNGPLIVGHYTDTSGKTHGFYATPGAD